VCLSFLLHSVIVDSALSDEAKVKDVGGKVFSLKHQEVTDSDQSWITSSGAVARQERRKPSQLKGAPAGVSGSVSYFVGDVGERKLLMALVSAESPKLYTDTDFDNDLSDEKAFAGETRKSDQAGSRSRRRTPYRFGPIALAGPDRDKGNTVKIVVRWYRGQSYVYLFPTAFRTGKVRLGKRSCKVVLIDGDLDGRYNSVFAGMSPSGQRTPRPDFLGIDLDQDGEFASSGIDGNRERRPLTKMMELDGRYYNLAASPDGAELRVAKATPKMGTLEMRDRDLQALLMCDSGYLWLRGSKGKMNVPVGKYRALYGVLSRTDEKGAKWMLRCRGGMGKLTNFEIGEGQVLKFNAGTPLSLKADVRKRGSTVSIGFSAVGQAGERYGGGAQKDGHRLPPPKLKILDEKGKVLSQGAFEYG